MATRWTSEEASGAGQTKEISNIHYPTSCYRPAIRSVAKDGVQVDNGVDWPELKRRAWEFLALPYDGSAALDFICPAWWTATACECECGDCSELFKTCPVGFMLFRALSLLCDARGNINLRLHELIKKHWGSGLLDFGKSRLGFKDIMHSGWPYFGVLSRVAEQLRMDGLSEASALHLSRHTWGEGALAPAGTFCAGLGWEEDHDYLALVSTSLDATTGDPVPLERSLRAVSSPGACPLQRAVARAATADWLLQPGAHAFEGITGSHADFATHSGWMSGDSLIEVEGVLQDIQADVRAWAAYGGNLKTAPGRPYFFELLVVTWPLWRMLHRVGVRLLGAFTLGGCAAVAPGAWRTTMPFSSDAGATAPSQLAEPAPRDEGGAGAVCPACTCSAQGEWAAEGRYVAEYAERLSEALFRRRAHDLRRSPSTAGAAPFLGPSLAAWRVRRWAAHPAMTWRERWAAIAPPHRSRSAAPRGRREAFVTVLFANGARLDKVLLHVEAIRTLAFSVRIRSRTPRPFLVVTDGPIPSIAADAFTADGLRVLRRREMELPATSVGAAYGADGSRASRLELQSWWLERGVAPTAVKLAIWNLTEYDCLVFLDADTLLVDAVDELFDITTFASGLTPYSTHGVFEVQHDGEARHQRHPGFNTGVMVLQPSAAVAASMAQQMLAGIHDNTPIAEHLGQSDQPWLDAYWLSYSRRLGFARFSAPRRDGRARRFLGCELAFQADWGVPSTSPAPPRAEPLEAALRRPWPRPGRRPRRRPVPLLVPGAASEAHCVLPLEYDFFSDYKAIRMHVWYEARERVRELDRDPAAPGANVSDIEWAIRRYIDDYRVLGTEGLKILHWPGELRKPWERWHRAVRSPWDDAWWATHAEMCRRSAAPCHLSCSA